MDHKHPPVAYKDFRAAYFLLKQAATNLEKKTIGKMVEEVVEEAKREIKEEVEAVCSQVKKGVEEIREVLETRLEGLEKGPLIHQ